MAKQPKDHVKKHLEKRKIDPTTLPDPVMDALNAFTPDELMKVDNLGGALMDAGSLSPDMKISAVH
jgi:hypothetical protein